MPWKTATNDDTTFSPDKDTGRIGERSSHTWFVLAYLLGLNNVRSGPFSRLLFFT